MDAAPAEATPSSARPRDRRGQIAQHAGRLFSDRGFHSVRMDDIAQASGITARALYRHYQNKQALLSHVVVEDQERILAVIRGLGSGPTTGARDLDQALRSLAEAGVDSSRLSLLWQREARHLDAADYQLVRSNTRWIAHQFRELLIDPQQDPATADIRSWIVVSIVSGHGFYESNLSGRRLAQELVSASTRVLAQPVAPPDPRPGETTERESGSRREQLIHAAARAFRIKGFGGVGIDDIGADLGIVGPAMYRYFDTKADILVAAVTRLYEWLALEASRAMRTARTDDAVITALVEGYVRIALEATDLVAVSLTEWQYLPAPAIDRLGRIRDDYLAEWQRWLSVACPGISTAEAAARVNMTKMIVDDCVRIPHLRGYPSFPAELTQAAHATLSLTGRGQGPA